MKKIDIKKIIALQKAGWKMESIAIEMNMNLDAINKVMTDYKEREKKRVDTKQKEKTKEVSVISLTTEQLKEICDRAAVVGAREALKIFEQERNKEYSDRVDRRLRNTKLLLRNYHVLKEHAENSVFGRTQMEESAIDILESMMSMYNNEIIIESIKRSATRTAIIVSHIEVMLGLYHSYCEHTSSYEIDLRRYEVIWDMYIADQTLSAKEIAEKQNISIRNVYEDIKVATQRLSALIFGVDGLKVH